MSLTNPPKVEVFVSATLWPSGSIIPLHESERIIFIGYLTPEEEDETAEYVAVLHIDDHTVITRSTKETWTAPQVVHPLAPINH